MKKLFVVGFVVAVALLLSSSALAVPSTFQSPLSYSIYVPLVDAPPCTDPWAGAEFYATASSPIVHVGEIVTFTGALYDGGCSSYGQALAGASSSDTAVLSLTVYYAPFLFYVRPGNYQILRFSFLATKTGPVTVTMGALYEVAAALRGGAASNPVPIRVVP